MPCLPTWLGPSLTFHIDRMSLTSLAELPIGNIRAYPIGVESRGIHSGLAMCESLRI
jgi:hypothetical protein